MKYSIVLLMLIVPSLSLSQISWSNPIVANDDASLGFTRPKVVVNDNGEAVVMWTKATNKAIYVSTFNGNSFSAPVKVNPDGMNIFAQDWAGPGIASFGNDVFVAFKAQPEKEGYIYVAKSTDGGKTFAEPIVVSDSTWSRFPNLAVDGDGNPVVVYMEFHPGWKEPGYRVYYSTDGGKSFARGAEASETANGEVCDCCPAHIICHGGNTYVLYRNNEHNLRDSWLAISDDSGASFKVNRDIDYNNWEINVCPSSGPWGVPQQDSLAVVWMSGPGSYTKVQVTAIDKAKGQIGFQDDLDADAETVNQNYPKIAGDESALGVVWMATGNGKREIKFVASTKGVIDLTRQTPVTVNDENSRIVQNPQIAYSNGIFHIVWEDVSNEQVMYRTVNVEGLGIQNTLSNANEKFQVTPMPGQSNSYYVSIPKGYEDAVLTITDINGRAVFKEYAGYSNKRIVNVDCSKGIYVYSLEKVNSVPLQRIVVQ